MKSFILINHFSVTINRNPKKYSFIVLTLLFILQIGFIVNDQWAGDFWEHCAVLKELIRDPVNPSHPIIHANLPHAFFSPYHVLLSLIGIVTHLEPIRILSIAGIFNLCLWVFGLFMFVKIFFPEKAWDVYLRLLLIHLFLWGPAAWIFSSFFHFNVLHLVLPYPSTFAVGLSFISSYLFSVALTKRYIIVYILIIIILNTIIILTHPTTYLFSLSCLAVIGYTEFRLSKKLITTVVAVTCCLLPFVLTYYWPYYSFVGLLGDASQNQEFHLDSKKLYENVLFAIGPALIVFFVIKRKDLIPSQKIILLLFALLVIYFYGFISTKYGYGRVISFIVLMLHLILAYKLSYINQLSKRQFLGLCFAIIVTTPYLFETFKTLYHNPPFIGKNSYEDYTFLESYLTHDDVVLTGLESIKLVPAFGGRVTASLYPPYWIKDNDERVSDVRTFFKEPDITPAYRQEMLAKYNVNYILLNKYDFSILDDLIKSAGLTSNDIVHQNKSFILIKVK